MISVGDSDGRKRLGFSAEGAMEETELEEGEACSYQNYDYNSTIDPDVALSYIDEKLQDVLGHFQKDFEGGVSAENLGAKFGGYGSFLPAYQRSPLLSRPRTPQKVHSCNAPKSHNNLHQEEGPNNSLVPSNTSLVVSKGSSSAPSVSLNPFRDSANVSSKRNERISSAYHAEESRSRCELDQSCSQASERTLRVRIKVGSDNLSTRKNTEIYSGLGLDISPSSSPDGSPIDSEGSREPFNAPEESPTSILQIMTSFPVHSNLLLSPLPDYLIYLNEKQKSRGENQFTSSQQVSKGSLSAKQGDKVKGGHKPKSLRKNGFPMEPKNHSAKDSQKGSGVLLKKEDNVYGLECEGLADDPRLANKLKRESSLDLGKGETLEAASIVEIGLVDKPSGKNASAGKVFEEETVNFPNDISVYLRKDGNFNGEKTSDLSTADSNVSYEKKARNTELCDLSELKTSKKATSLEEDGMKLASVKDHAVAGSKKKSKGSRSQVVHSTEVAKDSSIMDYSLMPKGRNRTHTDNIFSKGELEGSKIQKGLAKARNTYRDFFGDVELEQEDNDVDSEEMILTNRQDFGASASDITSKEKLDVKKMDKPSIPEAYSKAALAATPIKGNGPISEAVAGSSVPLVKEDWVCCDKCQKWRLLPLGTNPDSLPEKWLCSMLDWLPGMNRCSVSEEETTKAIVALHQLPAPGGGLPVPSLADASCFDQKPQNLGFHAVSAGGKKKHGVKDVSALTNQDGPANISNSEKNLQASVKCGSFNDVNLPPFVSEIETQHLSKSSVVEKHRSKQKGKKKVLEEHSVRGEIKSSVKGSKRDIDLGWPSVSKKAKVDTEHSIDDDWICDRDEPLRKVGPSSASGLSLNASGKDRHKNDDLLTRQRKRDTSNSSRGSLRNSNGYGTEKKRKRYESQDKHVNSSPVLSGHRLLGRSDFLEAASKNDHGKEKKARISKSEKKETSFSKGSGGPRKRKNIKDQKFGQDLESKLTQRNLDAMDSLKMDLGSGQPSQATSSSSKVSGSHKSKTRSKKVKGSPVESVSSSPLRFLNQDKSASIRRSLEGKDDFGDVALFTTGNPRRCSDGEDEGESDDFGIVRKDETFAMHRGSKDSSGLDFQGRDSGHIAGSGDKIKLLQSPEIGNRHFADGSADMVHLGNQHPIKPQNSYQCSNEEQGNEKQYCTNESRLRKTGKGSSSRSKEKNGTLTELDKGELKSYDFCDESIVHAPFGEKPRAQKNSVQERSGIVFHNAEQDMLIGKDEFKVVGENNKRDGQFKYRGDNSMDGKLDASRLDPKQNLWLDRDEILSKGLLSDPDHVEVSRRGKSHQFPSCSRGQSAIEAHSLHLVAGSQKENEAKSSLTDASRGDDTLKAPKPARRSENQNGNQHTKLRHPTPNGHRVKGVDAPSPARRDPSSQTGNSAMKEATDLKHLADRLKNSGSSADSTSLYFQAALKFLHGASLLESCHSETAKKGEMIMSMQVYSSTAKLCEFCAHEYEKSKDMAAAALAYKLMEVAYMRVIYSSHTSASKDRHELKTALQIVPLGESPSSSASDVDSLNNPTTLDKVLLGKGVSSPQVAGNHIIAARNRPNLVRLLKFAQDMNYAMEASRKSRNAFAAANPKAEEAQCREGISSIKKALDFSFQDVEGLLRLVRLAMDAISR